MKIGVLSDTHLHDANDELPAAVVEQLRGVDMILHAGDITHPSVIDFLETIAPTHAVMGNMDDPHRHGAIPLKKVVEAGAFRIGLIHGWGAPGGIEERVEKEFDDVHCIVYGHTHYPACHHKNGILFFNPGSPTDRRWAPFRSMGVLHVSDELKGEILRV
ncbi:MAG: metallophosphatase family protein [Nitrospirota bacterium]|nr:metallophosphatase family protein [Nitrospirota bacterium]